MKTNFLRDNITSLLTLILVPTVLFLIKGILNHEIKVAENIAFLLVGILASTLKDVTQYYYGANKSSNDRARVENEMKQQEQSVKQITTTESVVSPKPADDNSKLTALGYSETDIKAMTPEQIADVIANGTKKV